VVTRRSAALLMFGEGGSLRSQAATCEDADDVFFDERRQRIYVSWSCCRSPGQKGRSDSDGPDCVGREDILVLAGAGQAVRCRACALSFGGDPHTRARSGVNARTRAWPEPT
jgi:hypothetical protein